MEMTSAALLVDLTDVLGRLTPGLFIIIEFDAGLETNPYAQAAIDPDGFYCEVVSEAFLPRSEWPILDRALLRSGWRRPDDGDDNWWQLVDADPSDASQLLLDGLMQGRVCRDPSRISWRVGRFPPGPNSGEPVPVDAVAKLAA